MGNWRGGLCVVGSCKNKVDRSLVLETHLPVCSDICQDKLNAVLEASQQVKEPVSQYGSRVACALSKIGSGEKGPTKDEVEDLQKEVSTLRQRTRAHPFRRRLQLHS